MAVAAGAVPEDVLCAIRSLVEFIFQAQNLYHYTETLHALSEALREFHHYKNSIILAGGRLGKNGPLSHFEIPKLELMQGVVTSIQDLGAAYQWTSDITERCHITHVKTPYRLSNHRDFHGQCCRFMDRAEKRNFFKLFTTLKTGGASLLNEMRQEAGAMAIHYPEATWITTVLPEEQVSTTRQRSNLFSKTRSRISQDETTAFLVNIRPHATLSVDEAAEIFKLPDLRPALGDFDSGLGYMDRHGQRRSPATCSLPFNQLRVWHNLRLQQHSAQDDRVLRPAETLQALPPSADLPHGRCNTVLAHHSGGVKTSQTGTQGM